MPGSLFTSGKIVFALLLRLCSTMRNAALGSFTTLNTKLFLSTQSCSHSQRGHYQYLFYYTSHKANFRTTFLIVLFRQEIEIHSSSLTDTEDVLCVCTLKRHKRQFAHVRSALPSEVKLEVQKYFEVNNLTVMSLIHLYSV